VRWSNPFNSPILISATGLEVVLLSPSAELRGAASGGKWADPDGDAERLDHCSSPSSQVPGPPISWTG
jgi:hypothetical protein